MNTWASIVIYILLQKINTEQYSHELVLELFKTVKSQGKLLALPGQQR